MIRVEDAGIKLLGASLGIVPCRARFVGRFVAFSTFVSTTSGLFFGQAGALLGAGPLVPYLVGAGVEINQCRVLCRAVRNRHHHAIEQASRRTRRKILISTQVGAWAGYSLAGVIF